MNLNPFGLNSVYTKTNPSPMNANQSCGLHFGAGSGDYDCYQSSVPKKKENFWQKWKKWIIGGTVAVGAGILGIVGYNKGWFGKAIEAVKALSKTNPDNLGNDLEKALKTLEIESLTTGGKDIKSLLKNDTKIVTSNQFVDVAKEILSNKNLVKEEKNKTAAVKILEQLRKNLAQDAKIEGFDKSKEIKDISVLCNIINEPKIKTKIVLPNEEEAVEKPVEKTPQQSESVLSGLTNSADESIITIDLNNPNPIDISNIPGPAVQNPQGFIVPKEQSEASEKEKKVKEFNQKLTKLDEKINNDNPLTIVTSDIVDLFNEPIPFDNIKLEIKKLFQVLDTAIEKHIVKQEDIQNLLNDYIENGTIKKECTENFAFVLCKSIDNEVFDDPGSSVIENNKATIQGYIKGLIDNVDKNNAWAIANLLISSIYKKVFGDSGKETTKDDEKLISNSYKETIQDYIKQLADKVDNNNAIAIANVLYAAIDNEVFGDSDKETIQDYIKQLADNVDSNYLNVIAGVLDTAIRNGVFDDPGSSVIENNKATIQGYIKRLIDNVDNNNAWAVARVLDTAIQYDVFDKNKYDKETIQDYIKQLADKVDNNNAIAIANVLYTAIVNGVFGDNSDSITDANKETIQDCIKQLVKNVDNNNAGAIASVLEIAIINEVFNDNSGIITDNNKTTIQGHIKCLIDKVDKNNAGAIANLLINSIDKKVFGESDKETIQGYIKPLVKNVDSNNLNAITGVLDTAMRMKIVEQKDIQNLLNGYIENNTIKKEYIENFAFVLNTAIYKRVFGGDEDKIKKIKGYIEQLVKNVDNNNAWAIARVLDTAIQYDVFDKNKYDKTTIQGYIEQLVKNVDNNNAWAVANVLDTAIRHDVFNKDEEDKGKIQSYIKQLLDKIGNQSLIKYLLNDAKAKNLVDE